MVQIRMPASAGHAYCDKEDLRGRYLPSRNLQPETSPVSITSGASCSPTKNAATETREVTRQAGWTIRDVTTPGAGRGGSGAGAAAGSLVPEVPSVLGRGLTPDHHPGERVEDERGVHHPHACECRSGPPPTTCWVLTNMLGASATNCRWTRSAARGVSPRHWSWPSSLFYWPIPCSPSLSSFVPQCIGPPTSPLVSD